MNILLAPMEGVIDFTMRDMLTRIGGIDRCITEFVRVTNSRLPSRVFYRYCPELQKGGVTPSGVPVYVQLLGSDPHFMAVNAERVVELGAPGIDINFGCPAKTVNRHQGGSILLQTPVRIHGIVSSVRLSVPDNIPVTVKIRLGYADSNLFVDIVGAIIDAGANEITIHARTRSDGYKPPAYWHKLASVAANSSIPLNANGEIWTVPDGEQCLRDSACQHLMLGRGILACPDLARRLKYPSTNEAMTWYEVLNLLNEFQLNSMQLYDPRYAGNRLKQWLGYLRRNYPQAQQLFEAIKRLHCPNDIAAALQDQQQAA